MGRLAPQLIQVEAEGLGLEAEGRGDLQQIAVAARVALDAARDRFQLASGGLEVAPAVERNGPLAGPRGVEQRDHTVHAAIAWLGVVGAVTRVGPVGRGVGGDGLDLQDEAQRIAAVRR